MPSQNETAYSENMGLWRALIPSWKFFDQVGSTVEIRYRSGSSETAWGSWQAPSPPEGPRNFIRLFFNAEENLWLAKTALLERLAHELYEAPEPDLQDLKKTLNYKLVQNWIEQELRSTKEATATLFQFELQIQNLGPLHSTERWISAAHEL